MTSPVGAEDRMIKLPGSESGSGSLQTPPNVQTLSLVSNLADIRLEEKFLPERIARSMQEVIKRYGEAELEAQNIAEHNLQVDMQTDATPASGVHGISVHQISSGLKVIFNGVTGIQQSVIRESLQRSFTEIEGSWTISHVCLVGCKVDVLDCLTNQTSAMKTKIELPKTFCVALQSLVCTHSLINVNALKRLLLRNTQTIQVIDLVEVKLFTESMVGRSSGKTLVRSSLSRELMIRRVLLQEFFRPPILPKIIEFNASLVSVEDLSNGDEEKKKWEETMYRGAQMELAEELQVHVLMRGNLRQTLISEGHPVAYTIDENSFNSQKGLQYTLDVLEYDKSWIEEVAFVNLSKPNNSILKMIMARLRCLPSLRSFVFVNVPIYPETLEIVKNLLWWRKHDLARIVFGKNNMLEGEFRQIFDCETLMLADFTKLRALEVFDNINVERSLSFENAMQDIAVRKRAKPRTKAKGEQRYLHAQSSAVLPFSVVATRSGKNIDVAAAVAATFEDVSVLKLRVCRFQQIECDELFRAENEDCLANILKNHYLLKDINSRLDLTRVDVRKLTSHTQKQILDYISLSRRMKTLVYAAHSDDFSRSLAERITAANKQFDSVEIICEPFIRCEDGQEKIGLIELISSVSLRSERLILRRVRVSTALINAMCSGVIDSVVEFTLEDLTLVDENVSHESLVSFFDSIWRGLSIRELCLRKFIVNNDMMKAAEDSLSTIVANEAVYIEALNLDQNLISAGMVLSLLQLTSSSLRKFSLTGMSPRVCRGVDKSSGYTTFASAGVVQNVQTFSTQFNESATRMNTMLNRLCLPAAASPMQSRSQLSDHHDDVTEKSWETSQCGSLFERIGELLAQKRISLKFKCLTSIDLSANATQPGLAEFLKLLFTAVTPHQTAITELSLRGCPYEGTSTLTVDEVKLLQGMFAMSLVIPSNSLKLLDISYNCSAAAATTAVNDGRRIPTSPAASSSPVAMFLASVFSTQGGSLEKLHMRGGRESEQNIVNESNLQALRSAFVQNELGSLRSIDLSCNVMQSDFGMCRFIELIKAVFKSAKSLQNIVLQGKEKESMLNDVSGEGLAEALENGGASELRELDISMNLKMNKEVFKKLVLSALTCSQRGVRYLNLAGSSSHVMLTNEKAEALREVIEEHTEAAMSIEEIDLSRNVALSAKTLGRLLESVFRNCRGVRIVRLRGYTSFSMIENEKAKALSKALKRLQLSNSSFEVLDLSLNSIDAGPLNTVFKSLLENRTAKDKLINKKRAKLVVNASNGLAISLIPERIKKNTAVAQKVSSAGGGGLSSPVIETFNGIMMKFGGRMYPHLKEVVVTEIALLNPKLLENLLKTLLSASFFNLKKIALIGSPELQVLDDERVVMISEVFDEFHPYLGQLEEIDLSMNSINQSPLLVLLESVFQCENVRRIRLCGSYAFSMVNDDRAIALVEFFDCERSLEYIDLSFNLIEDRVLLENLLTNLVMLNEKTLQKIDMFYPSVGVTAVYAETLKKIIGGGESDTMANESSKLSVAKVNSVKSPTYFESQIALTTMVSTGQPVNNLSSPMAMAKSKRRVYQHSDSISIEKNIPRVFPPTQQRTKPGAGGTAGSGGVSGSVSGGQVGGGIVKRNTKNNLEAIPQQSEREGMKQAPLLKQQLNQQLNQTFQPLNFFDLIFKKEGSIDTPIRGIQKFFSTAVDQQIMPQQMPEGLLPRLTEISLFKGAGVNLQLRGLEKAVKRNIRQAVIFSFDYTLIDPTAKTSDVRGESTLIIDKGLACHGTIQECLLKINNELFVDSKSRLVVVREALEEKPLLAYCLTFSHRLCEFEIGKLLQQSDLTTLVVGEYVMKACRFVLPIVPAGEHLSSMFMNEDFFQTAKEAISTSRLSRIIFPSSNIHAGFERIKDEAYVGEIFRWCQAIPEIKQIQLEYEFQQDDAQNANISDLNLLQKLLLMPPAILKTKQISNLNFLKALYTILYDSVYFEACDISFNETSAINSGIASSIVERMYEMDRNRRTSAIRFFFKKLFYYLFSKISTEERIFKFDSQVLRLNEDVERKKFFRRLGLREMLILVNFVKIFAQYSPIFFSDLSKKWNIKNGSISHVDVKAYIIFGVFGVLSLLVEFWLYQDLLTYVSHLISELTITQSKSFLAKVTNAVKRILMSFTFLSFKAIKAAIALGQSLLARYQTFSDISFIIVCWQNNQLSFAYVSICTLALNQLFGFMWLVRYLLRTRTVKRVLNTDRISQYYKIAALAEFSALSDQLDEICPYNTTHLPDWRVLRSWRQQSLNSRILGYMYKFLLYSLPQAVVQVLYLVSENNSNADTSNKTVMFSVATSVLSFLMSLLKFLTIRPSVITQIDFNELAAKKQMELFDNYQAIEKDSNRTFKVAFPKYFSATRTFTQISGNNNSLVKGREEHNLLSDNPQLCVSSIEIA